MENKDRKGKEISKRKVRSGYSKSRSEVCSGYWVHSGPSRFLNTPQYLCFIYQLWVVLYLTCNLSYE